MHFLVCIFFCFLVCWDVTLLHILSLLIVNLNQIQLWSLFYCSVSQEVSFPKLLEVAVSQVLRSLPVSLFHCFHVKNNDEFVGHSLCLSFWRLPPQFRLNSTRGILSLKGSRWAGSKSLGDRTAWVPSDLHGCLVPVCHWAEQDLSQFQLLTSHWLSTLASANLLALWAGGSPPPGSAGTPGFPHRLPLPQLLVPTSCGLRSVAT